MSYKTIELTEITKERKLLLFINKVIKNKIIIENKYLKTYCLLIEDLLFFLNRRRILIINTCRIYNYLPKLCDYYDIINFQNYVHEITALYKKCEKYKQFILKFWNNYNKIVNEILFN